MKVDGSMHPRSRARAASLALAAAVLFSISAAGFVRLTTPTSSTTRLTELDSAPQPEPVGQTDPDPTAAAKPDPTVAPEPDPTVAPESDPVVLTEPEPQSETDPAAATNPDDHSVAVASTSTLKPSEPTVSPTDVSSVVRAEIERSLAAVQDAIASQDRAIADLAAALNDLEMSGGSDDRLQEILATMATLERALGLARDELAELRDRPPAEVPDSLIDKLNELAEFTGSSALVTTMTELASATGESALVGKVTLIESNTAQFQTKISDLESLTTGNETQIETNRTATETNQATLTELADVTGSSTLVTTLTELADATGTSTLVATLNDLANLIGPSALVAKIAELENGLTAVGDRTTTLETEVAATTSLSDLACTIDQVATFTSAGWRCGSIVPQWTVHGAFERQLHNSSDLEGFAPVIGTSPQGLTRIVHRNQTLESLEMFLCDNLDCSSGTNKSLRNPSGPVGINADLAFTSDGRPVILHAKSSGTDFEMVVCSNTDCSSRSVDSGIVNNVSLYGRLEVDPNDQSWILYRDGSSVLQLTSCSDLTCAISTTSFAVPTGTVVPADPVFDFTFGTDGKPILAYSGESPNGGLFLFACDAVACASGTTTTALEPSDVTVHHPRIAIGADGNPVVLYINGDTSGAELWVCGDPACTTGQRRLLGDADPGSRPSLAITRDGRPVATYSTSGSVPARAYVCGDATCGIGQEIDLVTGSNTVLSSVTIDAFGHPLVAVDDDPDHGVRVVSVPLNLTGFAVR